MTLHPLNADSIRHRRAHRLALARARAWAAKMEIPWPI